MLRGTGPGPFRGMDLMGSPEIAYSVVWADRFGRIRDSLIRRPNLRAVYRSIEERRRGIVLTVRGPFLSGRIPETVR